VKQRRGQRDQHREYVGDKLDGDATKKMLSAGSEFK
jgi:hypothetical protein